MRCPYCGSNKTKVTDKRETEKGKAIRRRRECSACEKRFSTYERIESVTLIIIKKDGNRQPYDRTKLERGIMRACEKRPVPVEEIKKMIQDIEYHMKNRNTTEIQSSLLGRLVMSRLKKLDKVSYIRFASVYKDFKDPEEFQEMIDRLVKD